MGDGRVHPVDQFDGDDHAQKLTPEIVRIGLHRARNFRKFALGADFDPGFQQVLDQHRAVLGVELPVHKKALRRAANAGAAGLGVQHHAAGLFQIGVAVGIDMADALKMREHRHAGFGLHKANKTLAATRHNHVDILGRAQHRRYHLAVTGRHHLDCRLGYPGLAQAPNHAIVNDFRGIEAFRAAAQNDGIAGF